MIISECAVTRPESSKLAMRSVCPSRHGGTDSPNRRLILQVSSIRVDPSLGLAGEPVYKASLGGISGRLIKVPDRSIYGGETYRVDFEAGQSLRVDLGGGAE